MLGLKPRVSNTVLGALLLLVFLVVLAPTLKRRL